MALVAIWLRTHSTEHGACCSEPLKQAPHCVPLTASQNRPILPCRMPWRLLAAILWLACLSPAAADEPHSYDSIRRLRRAEFRTQHPFAGPGQPAPPEVHLFIGVPSASAERRAAIRASWGKLASRQHGVVLRFFTHRDEGTHPDEAEAESSTKACTEAAGGCGDVVFLDDDLLSGGGLLPGQNGVTQKVRSPVHFCRNSIQLSSGSMILWGWHTTSKKIVLTCWVPLMMMLLTVHQPQPSSALAAK